jgi:hypothetical protein
VKENEIPEEPSNKAWFDVFVLDEDRNLYFQAARLLDPQFADMFWYSYQVTHSTPTPSVLNISMAVRFMAYLSEGRIPIPTWVRHCRPNAEKSTRQTNPDLDETSPSPSRSLGITQNELTACLAGAFSILIGQSRLPASRNAIVTEALGKRASARPARWRTRSTQ